jgi:hypothetical protein
MERGTVRVSSFRERIRKTGMTYASEETEHKSSMNTRLRSIAATVSNAFSCTRAGPRLDGDFVDASPVHLKSPVVMEKMFDQSASKYRYCGCVHVKLAAIFGIVLDLILIAVYLAVIAEETIDWTAAVAEEERVSRSRATIETTLAFDYAGDHSTTLSEISTSSDSSRRIYADAVVYETYLIATIVDALLAITSASFLFYGVLKDRPNFLIPEICLCFATVPVKIIQLCKSSWSGTETPFMTALGVITMFFSLWFAHVVFVYRRYMKDRKSFVNAHSLF